ncbi:MAG: AEC family transporter [Gammaproteobacteria bacterium]
MDLFLTSLEFAFGVTGPILLVVGLGTFLASRGQLSEAFIDDGSRLVFNFALPALLFITISKTRFETTANPVLITMGVAGTLLVFGVMALLARFLIAQKGDRGVAIQGAYRGNLGVVGLAYCVNAYGEAGLAAASLYVGLITILYNIIAVLSLNHYLGQHRSAGKAVKALITNPLILGIVLALPVSYFGWGLPGVFIQAGEYFAQITLPLALLCTGASLSVAALRHDPRDALFGTLGKALLSPLLITGLALALGFRGMELGILFLMAAPPTAASSYVMVRAMGGNAGLAANIIVLSTAASLLFTSLGLTALHAFGLM